MPRERLSPRRTVYSADVISRRRLFRLVTPGRILGLGLVLGVVFAALWRFPSGDYVFLPDRAHPVAPLVRVAGGREPDNGGGIYFVDVIVRKASLLEQLFGGTPERRRPLPALTGRAGGGDERSREESVALSEMTTSQEVAAAVALRTLGRNVTTRATGALIEAVEPGFPAAGRLEPTDVIVAVAGKSGPLAPAEVAAAMAGRRVGSTVSFTVLRSGKQKTITLRTVAARRGSTRSIVGVYLSQNETIHLPIRVSIDAHGIGGPSAGLAFALDVLQQLGRNVDRGHKIAATGEIYLNGAVGPIGGIKQKTIGAREAGVDAFLGSRRDRTRRSHEEVRARAANHPCEDFSTGVARSGNIA